MKPALTCLICLLFFGSSVFSQGFGTVRGLVTDENNNILAGANIIDLTSSKGIVADAYGVFQMSVIAGKTVSLEISYIGYLKDTVFVTAVAGEITNIKIQLKSSPKNVGVVVVESIVRQG